MPCIEAAHLRFRPIVMTTLTVLVISFPLMLGRGQGSEYGQRMGIVMLGGILFSAILTFFVVPCAFYLFERRRAAKLEEQKTLEAPQTMQLEVEKPQKRQARKALKAVSGD